MSLVNVDKILVMSVTSNLCSTMCQNDYSVTMCQNDLFLLRHYVSK